MTVESYYKGYGCVGLEHQPQNWQLRERLAAFCDRCGYYVLAAGQNYQLLQRKVPGSWVRGPGPSTWYWTQSLDGADGRDAALPVEIFKLLPGGTKDERIGREIWIYGSLQEAEAALAEALSRL